MTTVVSCWTTASFACSRWRASINSARSTTKDAGSARKDAALFNNGSSDASRNGRKVTRVMPFSGMHTFVGYFIHLWPRILTLCSKRAHIGLDRSLKNCSDEMMNLHVLTCTENEKLSLVYSTIVVQSSEGIHSVVHIYHAVRTNELTGVYPQKWLSKFSILSLPPFPFSLLSVLSFPPSGLPSPPLPSFSSSIHPTVPQSGPLNQPSPRGFGEHCELPRRVRAERGRQMISMRLQSKLANYVDYIMSSTFTLD